MREWSRSPVVRYGMILVAFAGTASLVTLFPRFIASIAAILLLFPVMLGAWCAGTRAGFLVAALGGVILVALPSPPLASGEYVWGERLLTLILYVALSICISSLLSALQSARHAANVGSRALWESEERHQRLQETVQEGVWLLDTHGSTLNVNRQMPRMLGYTADEIIGRPWVRLSEPREPPRRAAPLGQTQRGLHGSARTAPPLPRRHGTVDPGHDQSELFCSRRVWRRPSRHGRHNPT